MYIYTYTGGVNLVFLIQKIQPGLPQTWIDWSKIQEQLFGCEIRITERGALKGEHENSELYLDTTLNSKHYFTYDPVGAVHEGKSTFKRKVVFGHCIFISDLCQVPGVNQCL